MSLLSFMQMFFSSLCSLFTFLILLSSMQRLFFPFPNFYCPRTSRYLDHKFDTLNTCLTKQILRSTWSRFWKSHFSAADHNASIFLIFFYCRRSVLQTTRQQSTTWAWLPTTITVKTGSDTLTNTAITVKLGSDTLTKYY